MIYVRAARRPEEEGELASRLGRGAPRAARCCQFAAATAPGFPSPLRLWKNTRAPATSLTAEVLCIRLLIFFFQSFFFR